MLRSLLAFSMIVGLAALAALSLLCKGSPYGSIATALDDDGARHLCFFLRRKGTVFAGCSRNSCLPLSGSSR